MRVKPVKIPTLLLFVVAVPTNDVAIPPGVDGVILTFGISPYSSPWSVIVMTLNPSFAKIAVAKNILLMGCDQCALRRNLAEGEFSQCGSGEVTPKNLIDGAHVGCFPQLYEALAPAAVDQVITL